MWVIRKSFDNIKALIDGWGNTDDDLNYGWNFSNLSSPDADLRLNSFGKNGVPSSGSTDIYENDYPDTNFLSISSNDWLVNIDGLQANILASSVNGSCSISFDTDFYACELAGGNWDGSCSDIIYTSRYSCSLNSETWTPTNNCSGSPTDPSIRLACESLGGTWASNSLDICMKVFYASTDPVSGEIKTDRPLVSTDQAIPEDGIMHLISFDGFFHDHVNNNGVKEVGENDLSDLPNGMISISIHDYSSSTSTCELDKYRGGSSVNTLVFNTSLLPIINW